MTAYEEIQLKLKVHAKKFRDWASSTQNQAAYTSYMKEADRCQETSRHLKIILENDLKLTEEQKGVMV
jgi:hypothetical protein